MAKAPAIGDLLLQAAERIGARVADGAVELVGSRFNTEVLSQAVPESSIARHNNDLPQVVRAARIDDIPVLIGELSGPPLRANIEPQLRRHRNQATIARSWLAAEAPNLQLFLIGPPGAYSRSDWRQIAAEIEADDRICRKLVWLFDQALTLDAAEAFLNRTFVARPWPKQQQQVLLDTVASYALPDGWEEAVDKGLDFDGLVEAFIELETKL